MIFKTLLKASVFLVLIFMGTTSFAQNANPEVQRVLTPKNPGTAFVYSLVIPGAGQMYNDQVKYGLGIFFGEIILIGGGAPLLDSRNSDEANALGITMVGLGALGYLVQMIHAPMQSAKINDRNSLNYSSRFKLGGNSRGEIGLSFNF